MSRFTSLNIQPRKESRLKGRSPRIGVDMTGLSKFLAAHDSFVSDGTTFDGLITGGLSTQITSDHLGGLAQVSNLSFNVVNPGLFSDLFNGINPENEQVKTFLYFDDGTSILDAERVPLFDGTISNFPDITYDTVIFQAEPLDVRNNTLIGTLLTDSDAANTDKGLPDESVGKISPIIYGDHRVYKGDDLRTNDTALLKNNFTPLIYLGIDIDGDDRYMVCDHTAFMLNADGDDSEQQQIWGWDDNIKRYVRLATTFTIEGTDPVIISVPNNAIYYDHWYPDGSVTATKNGANVTITDEEILAEQDFSTYTSFAFTEAATTGDWAQVIATFPAYDNQAVNNIDAVVLMHYWVALNITADPNNDYTFKIEGALQTDPIGASYDQTRRKYTLAATLAGIAEDITVRMDQIDDSDADAPELRTYPIYKRIEYKPGKRLDLYFGGQGREYGVWVDQRDVGTAGNGEGYTEQHADDDGGGTLLENGAGVIESILRDETGIVSNNLGSEILNETDFATHDKWDTTGKCDDTGGNATWTFAAGSSNGTLTQTAVNRASAGINGARYQLTFTITTSVTPDGNSLLRLTTLSSTPLTLSSAAGTWIADGTHILEFQAHPGLADTNTLFIRHDESTATQGIFSLDDISIKEVVTLDLDSFNIASNDLSTTKLSFAILEQIESNTLIDSILKTLGSIGHYDELNRFRMRTYVSGDGFGASTTNYPGPEDVIDFDSQTVFKIETGVNDKIDANDSGPAFTATLTAGTYTGGSLATEIETQLEASGADNYTVTYSSSTGKFTLVDDTGGWALEWDTGSNTATSAGPLLGFDISADDNGATDTFTSNFPVFDNSLLFHPLIENSFTLRKVDDDIVTNFTVEYFQEYVNNRFQKTATVTDTTFHAETLSQTWRHPYTNDTTTAEFYRDFLKGRLRRKHYEGTLITKLSAVGFESWDFANIRHPILNGILGASEETTKWIVTDVGLNAETMEYMIGFVES